MKVGILTFVNTRSFGASLQMYASYRSIEKLGHQVEIINYTNDYMLNERHFSKSSSNKHTNRAKKILNKRDTDKTVKNFLDFEHKMNIFPNEIISTTIEIEKTCNRYDVMICGSDQVWNPNITGHDYNYFFEFCKDKNKKASYAPSFGVTQLNPIESSRVSLLLKEFRYLCVREKQGQELIKKLIGIAPQIVIDPTLLITKDEWLKEGKRTREKQKEYILFYSIKYSDKLKAYAKTLSKHTGLPIVYIGGNIIDKMNPFKKVYRGIGPEEWLTLFNNAKYIVTNSFHGTAFAINLQKEFFTEFSSLTNSRLENILDMFDLRIRQIVDGKNEYMDKSIDYKRVNKILDSEREKSMTFLRSILEQKNE